MEWRCWDGVVEDGGWRWSSDWIEMEIVCGGNGRTRVREGDGGG
jgi:hypothetical protein